MDAVDAIAPSGSMVGDDIDGGVGQFELTRQHSFRHAGHADHIGPIALQAIDLGRRFQARPLGGGIHSTIDGELAHRRGREQQALARTLLNACRELPHIIEITCANGLNVIAHADYPAAEYRWQKPVSAQRVLWDRDRLMGFMVGKGQGISGADHFWFGHTPVDRRYDFDNLHYIDTGAVFDGYFTLAQLQ